MTSTMWFGFRILDSDPEKAKELLSKIKVYHYKDCNNPPKNKNN